GTLLIENSTITANTASGQGGGIFGGVIVLKSSIVSGNSCVNSPEIAASVVNANYSPIGSHVGFRALNGNNSLPLDADLNLGSLTDNGGPTVTIRPQPGSPLINAGSNPANLATDQRGAGYPRVSGGAPDIGAVETNYPPCVRSVSINDGDPQRSRITS